MKILLLICVLASGLMAQKLPKGFEVEYDKFRDESNVSFRESAERLGAIVGFTHPGPALKTDVQTFYLYLHASRGTCYGYCFNNSELIFLIDGHRIRLENDDLDDWVAFPLSREIMQKMASAKLIEFQIARFRGEWKEKHIAKIKTLFDLATVK